MRTILAAGLFVLGLNAAAPEPDRTPYLPIYAQTARESVASALIEIDSALGRGDRLDVAAASPTLSSAPQLSAPQPAVASDESHDADTAASPLARALLDTADGGAPIGADLGRPPELPMADLCNALVTSARDNDLPVPFFANLIWQESRLRDDAVSPVGAQGIAQFMPKVAMESGLDDPFNPLQAIPASARFLHALREQFGNLGYVAAAYNAGASRVAEWLERRRGLPRETLGYVQRVTGRSAEQWRTTPPDDDALTFVRRLPCRDLPAFADLEQAQLTQAPLAQAQSHAAVAAPAPAVQRPQKPHAVAAKSQPRRAQRHEAPRVADRKPAREHARNEALRVATNHRGGDKRRADRTSRVHERQHKSA